MLIICLNGQPRQPSMLRINKIHGKLESTSIHMETTTTEGEGENIDYLWSALALAFLAKLTLKLV